MKRGDLGEDYDGWQVIDATPQELSDEMYRCGPTPVLAVKLGEVMRPYDTAFVYAEVNADKVFWKYYGPTQPLKLLNKDIHG
jgi:transglutaminase 1